MIRRLLLLFIFMAVILNCSYTQGLQKVRYMPHWLHQAQFAGYYMAKEKGFYQEQGLDVEILPGGPAHPALLSLENKKADITSTFLSGAIKAAASGFEVVDIAQLSQRSALMFIAKKSSGIETPEDFNGKKIGIWSSDFRELPLAFLKKYDINAEIVPISSTVNLFLKDGIDILCVMWYNEYHQIINYGIDEDELNVFHFHDYGLNYPEDAVICSEVFFENYPEQSRSFVQATIKGWEYAFANKEETLDVVIRYMEAEKIPASRAHQKWMLDRMEDILKPTGEPVTGILNIEQYELTAGVLLSSGAISEIPSFDHFNKTTAE